MKTRKLIFVLAAMAALLSLALFAGVASADSHPPQARLPHDFVTWSPRAVHVTVSPTVESDVVVTVTSYITLDNATIHALWPLNKIIKIEPATVNLKKGEPVPITLKITVPASNSGGDDGEHWQPAYVGILTVFYNRRPVLLPLPVVINPPRHR